MSSSRVARNVTGSDHRTAGLSNEFPRNRTRNRRGPARHRPRHGSGRRRSTRRDLAGWDGSGHRHSHRALRHRATKRPVRVGRALGDGRDPARPRRRVARLGLAVVNAGCAVTVLGAAGPDPASCCSCAAAAPALSSRSAIVGMVGDLIGACFPAPDPQAHCSFEPLYAGAQGGRYTISRCFTVATMRFR